MTPRLVTPRTTTDATAIRTQETQYGAPRETMIIAAWVTTESPSYRLRAPPFWPRQTRQAGGARSPAQADQSRPEPRRTGRCPTPRHAPDLTRRCPYRRNPAVRANQSSSSPWDERPAAAPRSESSQRSVEQPAPPRSRHGGEPPLTDQDGIVRYSNRMSDPVAKAMNRPPQPEHPICRQETPLRRIIAPVRATPSPGGGEVDGQN